MSDQSIAWRAYELWQQRGCPIGSSEVDWFQAVHESRVHQLFEDWWTTPRAGREQITQRAYQLWQQRGRPMGSPDVDWFRALHEEIANRACQIWRDVGWVGGSPDADWFAAEDYVGWLITQAPALQSRIPEFVEQWRAIGLSTAPTDRAAAESAIGRCYDRAAANRSPYERAANKRPERFIWLKSPLAGALSYKLLLECSGPSMGTSVWAGVPGSIRDRLRKRVGPAIEPWTWDGIWDSVEQAFAAVGGACGAADSVPPRYVSYGEYIRFHRRWDRFGWRSREAGIPGEDGVVAAVRDSVGRDFVAMASEHVVYGSHEAAWLFPYSYFFEACGFNQYEIFDGLFEQARHCGWWWPLRGLVIATEEPVSLHLDDRGRLHHSTDPAIAYGDGWGVYAWHGTRIPPQYYAQPVTARQVLKERNAEVRRALIERYGQDRFFLDAGAAVLDRDREHGAELISIDLPADSERRMVALKLRCRSTSAVYIVRVPPQYGKAREALAWSYGLWGGASDYVLAGES